MQEFNSKSNNDNRHHALQRSVLACSPSVTPFPHVHSSPVAWISLLVCLLFLLFKKNILSSLSHCFILLNNLNPTRSILQGFHAFTQNCAETLFTRVHRGVSFIFTTALQFREPVKWIVCSAIPCFHCSLFPSLSVSSCVVRSVLQLVSGEPGGNRVTEQVSLTR